MFPFHPSRKDINRTTFNRVTHEITALYLLIFFHNVPPSSFIRHSLGHSSLSLNYVLSFLYFSYSLTNCLFLLPSFPVIWLPFSPLHYLSLDPTISLICPSLIHFSYPFFLPTFRSINASLPSLPPQFLLFNPTLSIPFSLPYPLNPSLLSLPSPSLSLSLALPIPLFQPNPLVLLFLASPSRPHPLYYFRATSTSTFHSFPLEPLAHFQLRSINFSLLFIPSYIPPSHCFPLDSSLSPS